MENRKNKRKNKAALSAQQSIPYVAMHPDGVCQLPGGLYTKTVEYEDINYSVASTEDQSAIFIPFMTRELKSTLVGWLNRLREPVQ